MTIISWTIYGLRENTSGSAYRYVGLTTGPSEGRLYSHIVNARNRKTSHPLSDWIKVHGEDITLDVIEECPVGDLAYLHEREIYWISVYRDKQGSLSERHTKDYLLNISDGGHSNYGGTAWNKGMVMSEEYRHKLSIAHIGQYGHRAGIPHTDEVRSRIGAASKKAWLNPEVRARTNSARNVKCSGGAWKDRQRQSQMKSAHIKYHLGRGIKKTTCAFCTGRYPSY